MVCCGYMKQHIVKLSTKEHKILQSIGKKGVVNARVMKRARALLFAHRGDTDTAIADAVGVTARTVASIRERFATGGLERALYDASRPGGTPVLSPEGKATLVAIACSAPPEGRASWTLTLLRERLLEEKVTDHISLVTVWTRLKESDLKPWRKKNVVYPKAHRRIS